MPILYEDDAPICTVAPTRSGKGRGVIIPNLLRYSGAVYDLDLRASIRSSPLAVEKKWGKMFM